MSFELLATAWVIATIMCVGMYLFAATIYLIGFSLVFCLRWVIKRIIYKNNPPPNPPRQPNSIPAPIG